MVSKSGGLAGSQIVRPTPDTVLVITATMAAVKKTTLIYGAGLAMSAFALQWLDYQYTVRVFATELYVVLIAIGFTALGVWAGYRLTARPGSKQFEVNRAALDALLVSAREYEVLQLLDNGHSNKEIAEQLCVSLNTVKTHVARLYEKLDVSRRTQAVRKAKSLRLIA